MVESATFICTADLYDGLAIDIIAYAGLPPLSAEQETHLWEQVAELQLIEENGGELRITSENPAPEGTITYDLFVQNEQQFKAMLKADIQYHLGELL